MPPRPVPPAEKVSDGRFHDQRALFPFDDRLIRRAVMLLFALWLTATVKAGTVYWGSESFARNIDSKGREWDAGFSLSLGVFQSGFTPTSANREQWLQNWTPLGVAEFNAAESRFAGIIDTTLAPPNLAGRSVYFWASNGSDLTKGPEWLLLTHPSWLWPPFTASAMTPAITWTSSDALSFVLGQVSGQGLRTISVRPVPVPQGQWLARFFQTNPSSAEPGADPDGDGMSNSLEYFLGSDPSKASSTVQPELHLEAGKIHLGLNRNPYAVGGFILKSSTDLRTWNTRTVSPVMDRPDRLELSLDKLPGEPAAFFRFELHGESE